jgi:hypothetical protein
VNLAIVKARQIAYLHSCGRRAVRARVGHTGLSQVNNLSDQTKWMLYAALNLMFCLVLIIGSAVGGGSLAPLPYVALLFAICSSPLPFVDRFNGPIAMLAAAMAVYFVEFGALDAVLMLKAPMKGASADNGIGRTEIVLWLGAVMQIAGFYAAARIFKIRGDVPVPKDWSRPFLVPIGLMLWTAALAATLYHDFVVQPENTSVSVQAGLAKLGIWRSSGLILIENYAGPLGIMIIAYWWAVWGKRAGTPLILTLIFAQFIIGWIVDTKEVAISAAIVALLTRFIVLGKIPMRWLIGAMLAIALVFPILSAKRVVMTEELQLTRTQALPRTFEILLRTLQEGAAIETGKYEQSSETFLQRESVKGNVDLIIKGTAVGHPYKLGSTFEPLLYVFLPRVLWSDKPGGNSAQMLNREFHISADPDTFISPSHLGEWYWNFGLAGVIVGMALSGALLGCICVRFDPSSRTSITRVLVIIVTLYLLVARSEGQVEIQYALWARSMVLIGLLHLLFARGDARRVDRAVGTGANSSATRNEIDLIRFPNLMR